MINKAQIHLIAKSVFNFWGPLEHTLHFYTTNVLGKVSFIMAYITPDSFNLWSLWYWRLPLSGSEGNFLGTTKNHKKIDSLTRFLCVFCCMTFFLLKIWSNEFLYQVSAVAKKGVKLRISWLSRQNIKIQTSIQISYISQPLSGPLKLPAVCAYLEVLFCVKGPKKLKLNRPRIPAKLLDCEKNINKKKVR